MAFATRVGICPQGEPQQEPVREAEEAKEGPVRAVKAVKKVVQIMPKAMPAILRAPKSVAKKAVARPATPPPVAPSAKSSFAQFMSACKGKGLSMAQMAQLYKSQR